MLDSNISLYYGCSIPSARFRKFFEKHFIAVVPGTDAYKREPLLLSISDAGPEYEQELSEEDAAYTWPGSGITDCKEFMDYLKEYILDCDIRSTDDVIIGIEIDRYSVDSRCLELLNNTRDEYQWISPCMSGAEYLSEITKYFPKVLSLIIYDFCQIDDDFFKMLSEHEDELQFVKL